MNRDAMSSWRVLAVMAMATLVVCGCGGSTPAATVQSSATGESSSAGFTAADLCALATPAEVGAALGGTVGAGVPSGVNAPSCSWQDSGSSSGATIAATDPGAVGQIPFGLQNVNGSHVTAVSGLGDAAFFASGATGTTAELDIRMGGRAITITVGLSDPNATQAQQEAAELAIGKAAAGRM